MVVLLFFVRHHGRKRAERLAPAFELGTSRRVGPLGTVVEGLYRGYHCRYTIQNASQYNPGGASLRLALTGPHRWTAELTDTGGRLMVKLGIFKDLEIGDPPRMAACAPSSAARRSEPRCTVLSTPRISPSSTSARTAPTQSGPHATVVSTKTPRCCVLGSRP